LSWALGTIDNNGENILSLEAHGSCDPIDQKKLVDYYQTIGFTTCADLSQVDDEKYFNNAICMYSSFENIWDKCHYRFNHKLLI